MATAVYRWNDDAWQQWTTSMTTVVANCTVAWNNWATVTSTAAMSLNSVWTSWVTTSTTTITGATGYQRGGSLYGLPSETAEQREARARRDAERMARVAEAETQRAALAVQARDRALETLRLVLTDEQWTQYEREERFELITQSGKRYRISRGHAGNVKLIEDDEIAESLCVHPRMAAFDEAHRHVGDLPNEDAVIAQVLALQTDEDAFRKVANITDYRAQSAAMRRARAA